MRIEILGTGGGNTPELGNSSFLIWNDEMSEAVLFDCGYMTYPRLKELESRTNCKREVLNKIKSVGISHLHADHAGSLGALLGHLCYLTKTEVKIAGVSTLQEYIQIVDPRAGACITGADDQIKTISTSHDAVPSCALYWNGVLYSGDTNQSQLTLPEAREAKIIIHEGRMNNIDSHMDINILAASASEEIRKKTWIIHYSPHMAEAIFHHAKELGFAGVCVQGQIIEV